MSIAGLKNAGGMVAGVILFLAVLAIPIMFLLGAAEFSVWVLDWIPDAVGLATFACVMLIPLAIIPATRGFAAGLFGLASFVFGACMWLYALAFTYLEWGFVGVVIGVMAFGVGVMITGIVAAVLSGTWVVLGNLAFVFALFVGARLLSTWMEHLAGQRHSRRAMRETPSQVTITPKTNG